MSGAARIQMQQIEVAGLAAPLAVLRQQMASLGAGTPPDLAELVLQSPALLLQVLARQAPSDVATAAVALHRLDPSWLQHNLRHKALQLALADDLPDQGFLIWHWLLSRRVSLHAARLARLSGTIDPLVAAACGLLLPSGMLVLQHLLGSAYTLAAPANWPQRTLLALEQAQWQHTHIEVGTQLLEGLGLDQFFVDALRYQALPLSQVLDAAPLVKICWLAARFAETGQEASAALLAVGRQLLRLDPADLSALPATVETTLAGECATLGYRPLPPEAWFQQDTAALLHSSRQQIQLLRQQVLAEDLLLRHGHLETQTPAGLQDQLTQALQDAGFESSYILLVSRQADPQLLEVLVSSRTLEAASSLTLVCTTGRSALATLIEGAEVETLSADSPCLTVIDRQMLALLRGTRVLCEPVHAGTRRAALLLGLDTAGIATYCSHGSMRRFVKDLLYRTLQQPAGDAPPLSALLYQQRVRDAVHEAANPLTIIKNYLHVLTLRLGGEQEAPEELSLVKAEIDRIAGILEALREPEDSPAETAELDLNALVGSMHRMFAAAFGPEQRPGQHTNMALNLAPAPVRVNANGNALKQILTNLVKNAIEAVGTGGIITISTRAGVWQQGRLYGQLSVRDNGPGIAPEVMARLFTPGLSTKGGRHSGAGMSIVKSLVDGLQGQISCQSDGEGTTLTILLPQAE